MTFIYPYFMILRRRGLLLGAVLCCGAFGLFACASNHSDNTSPSTSAPNGYYRVQRGDNLYRIGKHFGQSVDTLVQWNHLHSADAIEVGQLIRVRSNGASTPSPSQKPAPAPRRKPQSTPSPRPQSTSPPPASGGGAPNVSLQWPVRGSIVSAYNGTTQKGIDIAGTRGTPVKAAAAGTVQYVGEELRGYGKLILLKHSATTLTAYAYNDSLRVRKGQKVQAGTVIATMGDSGTQGVKLHFEIRVNGTAVNPQRYLPR